MAREEGKPPMSIQEIEAVLVALPDEQLDGLWDRVVSQRVGAEEEIEPEILAEARRRLQDMRSGRVASVPFEQMLDDLEAAAMQIPSDDRAALADRLISSLTGTFGYDPEWIAELNRRIDEVAAGTAVSVPAEQVFAKMRARREAGSLSR